MGFFVFSLNLMITQDYAQCSLLSIFQVSNGTLIQHIEMSESLMQSIQGSTHAVKTKSCLQPGV